MQEVFTTNNKQETWDLAPEVLGKLGNKNVILLKGELGSGKTTFAQGVLKFLGAQGPFTSPTFVIMKKYELRIMNYESNDFQPTSFNLPATSCVYHLDCYRVGAKDVLELGWEEIIRDKSNLVLVEWPEKIRSILPESCLQLDFKIKGENRRKIELLKD